MKKYYSASNLNFLSREPFEIGFQGKRTNNFEDLNTSVNLIKGFDNNDKDNFHENNRALFAKLFQIKMKLYAIENKKGELFCEATISSFNNFPTKAGKF